MKKISLLFMLPMLLLGACTLRDALPSPQDSKRVAVRFGVDVPNFTSARLVGLDENAIGSLELWIFDRDGHFLERATATNITDVGAGKRSYEAMMTPAPEGCIIHFVANKKLTGSPIDHVGRDEADLLFAVGGNSEGNKMTMWARKVFTTPIAENTNLGEVGLLRNMVKFGLHVTTSKLADVSYCLYRTLDKGSIAPFNPSNLSDPFNTTLPTEPAGAVYADYSANWLNADGNSFHYGYERKNATAADIACLIIKAKYNGAPDYSYYKIDFVNTQKVRYDLLRNHFYKVTINDVRQAGYPSVAAALNGAAANNLALSEEVQMYPTFSDGLGRLEVEKTFFLFTTTQASFSFKADYFPDIANAPTVKANDRITLTYTGDAINGTPTNNNGVITVPLSAVLPGNSLQSELIISVNDNPELKRLVKVEVRPKYDYTSFTSNGATGSTVSVPRTQNTDLTFVITLPEEFRQQLLPMTLRFYTENFYPSVHDEGFNFGRKNNKTFYQVWVTQLPADRKLTYHFKSNRKVSAETIQVECVEQYFNTKSIQVTNP